MRLRLLLPVAVLLLALPGCISGDRIADGEVAAFGTKKFAGEKPNVMEATAATLRAMGYEIANANLEKGLLQTQRKFVTLTAQGNATVSYYRQYLIRFRTDAGAVEVTAVPKLFANDMDVSHQAIWDMRAEQTLWNELFSGIDMNL